jgi:RNA ligase
MEKVDGSMGSVFLNPQTKQPQVATRGSVDNEQSKVATEMLSRYRVFNLLARDITLIVEIVYPENRVVVDYGELSGLILLAARHNQSGKFVDLQTLVWFSVHTGMPLPTIKQGYYLKKIVDELPTLSVNEEGFVAVFESGERFKFKGDAYKQAHRILSGISYKRTIEYMESDDLDTLFEIVPDEWLDTVKAWISSIEADVGIMSEAVSRYLDVERDAKELVQALRDDNVSNLLFACTMNAFRNKPFKPLVLKHLKKGASSKGLIFGGEV